MKTHLLSRRSALARTGLFMGAAVLGQKMSLARGSEASAKAKAERPFLYCLNTATIRGQKLGIIQQAEIAAQAGYDAIEPWLDSIGEYVKNGGTLADLKKRINELGLTVESAIAFAEWLADDE